MFLLSARLAAGAETSQWAVAVDRPGLPNLHKVSDTFYRGAQPTEEGFRELKTMGIKTIICLRSYHTDSGKFDGTNIGYEHLWVKTWHPEDEDVARFLKIVTDPEARAVLFYIASTALTAREQCAPFTGLRCKGGRKRMPWRK